MFVLTTGVGTPIGIWRGDIGMLQKTLPLAAVQARYALAGPANDHIVITLSNQNRGTVAGAFVDRSPTFFTCR